MDYELIRPFNELGVYVFPCDGNKRPLVKKWRYKEGEPNPTIPPLFWDKATYVAIQCGSYNGGVECIDFDIKYGESFIGWIKLLREVDPQLERKLYIERSPSGGMHVIYRCDNYEGNKKLARLKDSKEYAIETRGEGGYVIIAPSYGYTMVQGDMFEFPFLTNEERDILINSAKTFNYKSEGEEKKVVTKLTKQAPTGAESKVFEYFNKNFNLLEYLQDKGWECVKVLDGGCKYMKRPGTGNNHSATLDFHPGIFTVFSSNVDGFEPGNSYNYSQVYGIMEYGGDYKAAYRAIKAMYFDQFDTTAEKPKVEVIENDLSIVQKIERCAKSYLMAGQPINPQMIKSIQGIVGIITDSEFIKDILVKYYEKNDEFLNFDNFTPTYKAAMLIKSKFELYVNIVDNKLSVKTKKGRVEVVPSDIWLELSKSVEVKYETVKRLCFNSKISTKHDPFEDYFKSLEWNGEDEVAKLCSFIKVKNQATHDKMFKKMLIRACRCVLGHGYNRYVWVYTGNQNNGKSTLIKFLCPKELMEYYTEESPSADHKDSLIRLQENFIYNWEELQEGRSQDLRRMKAIISKSEVKQRKSYAENEERKVRRASFFASTNDTNFLIDVENTRWLINHILSIDWEYRNKVDINNLWAQVYKIYLSNPDAGNLDMEESREQAADNENYEFHTNDEELLVSNFARANDDNNPYNMWMTSSEIMNALFLRYSNKFQLNKIAIGRTLMKRKYLHKRASERGGLTVFKVIDLDPALQKVDGVRNPYEANKEPIPF